MFQRSDVRTARPRSSSYPRTLRTGEFGFGCRADEVGHLRDQPVEFVSLLLGEATHEEFVSERSRVGWNWDHFSPRSMMSLAMISLVGGPVAPAIRSKMVSAARRPRSSGCWGTVVMAGVTTRRVRCHRSRPEQSCCADRDRREPARSRSTRSSAPKRSRSVGSVARGTRG